jgi:hypothetical protein
VNANEDSSKKTKDVEIGGRRFRIGIVPAAIGNWHAMQVVSGRALRDKDVWEQVQDLLLSYCWIYKQTHAGEVPIRFYNGERRDETGEKAPWLEPDLAIESDVSLFNKLTMEASDFNFDPTLERVKAEIAVTKKDLEEKAKLASTQSHSPKV